MHLDDAAADQLRLCKAQPLQHGAVDVLYGSSPVDHKQEVVDGVEEGAEVGLALDWIGSERPVGGYPRQGSAPGVQCLAGHSVQELRETMALEHPDRLAQAIDDGEMAHIGTEHTARGLGKRGILGDALHRGAHRLPQNALAGCGLVGQEPGESRSSRIPWGTRPSATST